jgi:hypothetical protein
LDLVLSEIFKLADFFARQTDSDASQTRERMNSIEKHIRDIERKKDHLEKDISNSIIDETTTFTDTLREYVNSREFQNRFCDWSDSFAPPIEDTWSTTKANIKNAIKDRFQEFLQQWDSERQYHARLHRKLVDVFLARFVLRLLVIGIVFSPFSKVSGYVWGLFTNASCLLFNIG